MPTILTINSGSSSLKATLFKHDGSRQNFRYTHLTDQHATFEHLTSQLIGIHPDIVGHRMVHGGDITDAARRVDNQEQRRLENLRSLAPLHLPGNLMGLEFARSQFDVPQIACFDTAFHATMPKLATRLPIPEAFALRRYGFHGLNYAHIATQLPGILAEKAHGKIVIAHLGSGASLCLIENLQSQATTMGYTPAGGIPMGTRSGDLDPGVMLELAARFDPLSLRDIVFHQMGLLALSDGESSDMNDLLASTSEAAQFAVTYFCQQISSAIGSFAARAGGIDGLVFTGGIGENSALIRQKICRPLEFMGFTLDDATNQSGNLRISSTASHPILVIRADEEQHIATLCQKFLV